MSRLLLGAMQTIVHIGLLEDSSEVNNVGKLMTRLIQDHLVGRGTQKYFMAVRQHPRHPLCFYVQAC